MLPTSRKRRRSEIEQTDEENKEMASKKEIEEIMHTILSLKQRIDDYQQLDRENDENSKKLSKLYDMRIINKYGDPIEQSKNDM